MGNSLLVLAWTVLPFRRSELLRIRRGPPPAKEKRQRKSARKCGTQKRDMTLPTTENRRFVGWGGGIPIWKNGAVAGAVAVSGLSSREDIELVTLALEVIDAQKNP